MALLGSWEGPTAQGSSRINVRCDAEAFPPGICSRWQMATFLPIVNALK